MTNEKDEFQMLYELLIEDERVHSPSSSDEGKSVVTSEESSEKLKKTTFKSKTTPKSLSTAVLANCSNSSIGDVHLRDLYHEPHMQYWQSTSEITCYTMKRDVFMFAKKYVQLVNNGDFDRFRKLISTCFNDNLLIQMYSPAYTLDQIGSHVYMGTIIETFSHFPDGVMKNISWKCFRDRSHSRVIRWKFSFEGTFIAQQLLPEYLTEVDESREQGAGPYDPIKDLPAEIPEEDRKNISKTLDEYAGVPMSMCYDGKAMIYIDDSTNKVGKMVVTYSLRGVGKGSF